MKTEQIEVPVRLRAFGAEPAPARAAVELNPRRLRVRRALATLGTFWGLAVATAFIPVAHFVLVPACLVAGPVLAVLKLREQRTLVRLEGRCTRCGLEQTFESGGRFPPARPVICRDCRAELQVEADA